MMKLSKNDTKMIQGLCVLAMVWLHLFDTWNYEGLFKPLLFFNGYPLTMYIAQLSDFCVMGFAFCSGYAHYVLLENNNYYKNRLKSLLKLCIKYWVVLIVFTLVSILLGKQSYMPGSWKTFLLSVFFLSSYNGAWWYLFIYIVIVLTSPLILKQIKERPLWLTCLCCGLLYCLSYYYRFNILTQDILLSKLGPLGMTFVEYAMGAVAAKYHYFSIAHDVWNTIKKPVRVVLSLIIIVTMLLMRTLVVPSLFVAPITGMIIITLFQFWKKPNIIEKTLLFMGEHSTHIWLTHMFFYLYLFVGLVYKAMYPLLIFAFMIVITILVSVVLNYIEETIYSFLNI